MQKDTNVFGRLLLFLKSNALYIFLLLTFASVQGFYLFKNEVPLKWDDSWFYENTIKYYDQLTNEGLFRGITKYIYIGHTKPPLLNLALIPFIYLFGRSLLALKAFFIFLILANNILFLLFLSKNKLRNNSLNLILFSILNLSPMAIGLSRTLFADYLMGTVIMSIVIVYLHYFEFFLLGFLFALGFLVKTQFILYVFPIAIVIFIKSLKKIKNFIFFVGPTIILFFPWLYVNFKEFINFTYSVSFGSVSSNYGVKAANFITELLLYLGQIANFVVGNINLIGIILLIAIYLIKIKKTPDRNFYLLLLTTLFFMGIFMLGKNKAIRFAYPIVIYLSILLALLYKGKNVKLWIPSFVLIALSFYSFINSTLPLFNKTIAIGNSVIVSPRLVDSPYVSENWKQREIIEFLNKKLEKSDKRMVILVGDYEYFNLNNFSLEARLSNSNLEFATTAYYDKKLTNDQVFEIMKTDEVFIYKTKGRSSVDHAYNYRNDDLYRKLMTETKEIGRFDLPDASQAIILERL